MTRRDPSRCMLRIAFDLDETLGTPLIDAHGKMVGFQWREGAMALFERLSASPTLIVWSVSPRRYVDFALDQGLRRHISESVSWDEKPCSFKDIREIGADLLIDDDAACHQRARELGLEARYIEVIPIGRAEDRRDPRRWLAEIEARLGEAL